MVAQGLALLPHRKEDPGSSLHVLFLSPHFCMFDLVDFYWMDESDVNLIKQSFMNDNSSIIHVQQQIIIWALKLCV